MTKNTFTRKPSFFQLVSYFVLLLTLCLLHLVLIPQLSHSLILPFHILAALLLLSLLLAAGFASGIDPGYKNQNAVNQYFYCDQCKIMVDASCKHCKACQQCVGGFDHHCKWINNCIGRQNYWSFSAMICSSGLYLGMYCLCCILSIVQTKGKIEAALLAGWIWTAPVLLLLFLNIYLILFHIWIKLKGISTYEYLKSEMNSSKSRKQSRIAPCEMSSDQLN